MGSEVSIVAANKHVKDKRVTPRINTYDTTGDNVISIDGADFAGYGDNPTDYIGLRAGTLDVKNAEWSGKNLGIDVDDSVSLSKVNADINNGFRVVTKKIDIADSNINVLDNGDVALYAVDDFKMTQGSDYTTID